MAAAIMGEGFLTVDRQVEDACIGGAAQDHGLVAFFDFLCFELPAQFDPGRNCLGYE